MSLLTGPQLREHAGTSLLDAAFERVLASCEQAIAAGARRVELDAFDKVIRRTLGLRRGVETWGIALLHPRTAAPTLRRRASDRGRSGWTGGPGTIAIDARVSLAAADFDGDGHADLAIGIPWKDTSLPNEGAVYVIHGSQHGLNVDRGRLLRPAGSGLEPGQRRGGRFGWAMAGERTASGTTRVGAPDV